MGGAHGLQPLRAVAGMSEALSLSRTVSGYEEVRHLGRGAFGEVVLARRIADGTLCAVKHVRRTDLDNKEIKEHQVEVLALQTLNHPCVLRYFSSEVDEHTLHIVTEYADAGDLQQLIKRRIDAEASFEAVVLFAILAQLVRAIAHVHMMGVMHRDLKPANVFLTTEGAVKLGDFGVAKVMAGTTALGQMTCVGSPTYMAPEVVGGEMYGHACDIWSLGCIFYELCALKKPFEGRSLGELVLRISAGTYKALDKVMAGGLGGASLAATAGPLLERMLVVNPRARGTAGDLARDPVMGMFVNSLQSCRACLQAAFRGGGGGGDDAMQSEITIKDVTTIISRPAKRTSGLPPPAPVSKLPASDKMGDSDTFNLSMTSAFDTEVSFSLSITKTDDLPNGSACATALLDDHTRRLANSSVRGDQAGSAQHSTFKGSYDADAMRPVLGDAIEERPSFKGSYDADAMRSVLGDAIDRAPVSPQRHADPASPNSASSYTSSILRRSRSEALLEGGAQEAAASSGMGRGQRGGGQADMVWPGNVDPDWEVCPGSAPSGSGVAAVRRLCSNGRVVGAGSSQVGSRGSTPGVGPSGSAPGNGRSRDQPNSAACGGGGGARVRELDGYSRSPSGGPGAPLVRVAKSVVGASNIADERRDASVARGGDGGGHGSAHEARQPPPRQHHQALGSSARDDLPSRTWPAERAVASGRGGAERTPNGTCGADARDHLLSAMPPAGRPTTPESVRARRSEMEHLKERDRERRGPITIPFFDRPKGQTWPQPPEAFLEAHQAHDLRQKQRAAKQVQRQGPEVSSMQPSAQPPGARPSSLAAARRGSKSMPSLHTAPPAAAATPPPLALGRAPNDQGNRNRRLGR